MEEVPRGAKEVGKRFTPAACAEWIAEHFTGRKQTQSSFGMGEKNTEVNFIFYEIMFLPDPRLGLFVQ